MGVGNWLPNREHRLFYVDIDSCGWVRVAVKEIEISDEDAKKLDSKMWRDLVEKRDREAFW